MSSEDDSTGHMHADPVAGALAAAFEVYAREHGISTDRAPEALREWLDHLAREEAAAPHVALRPTLWSVG